MDSSPSHIAEYDDDPTTDRTSAFVLSLDFELFWGRFDTASLESWRDRILVTREEVIPRLLDLLERYEIHTTWATVGFLMTKSGAELDENAPSQRPAFSNPAYSAYEFTHEIGASEVEDPCRLAASLVDMVKARRHQEIGTHTYSHFFCLEDGPDVDDFESDIRCAKRVAERLGLSLRSIVFPWNQYSTPHLEACLRQGITSYRGVEPQWYFASSRHGDETKLKRLCRLIDSLFPFSHCLSRTERVDNRPVNVPSSQFYRTLSRRTRPLHRLHLAKIKNGMKRAAKTGSVYHLWFHPHNLSVDVDYHLSKLEEIFCHYRTLRDTYGMRSLNMGEIADSMELPANA